MSSLVSKKGQIFHENLEKALHDTIKYAMIPLPAQEAEKKFQGEELYL